MRARYTTTCWLCETEIEPGHEIAKLLAQWAHLNCKSAEVQRRKSDFGPPVELEPEMPDNLPVQYVGVRSISRRSLKGFRRRKQH